MSTVGVVGNAAILSGRAARIVAHLAQQGLDAARRREGVGHDDVELEAALAALRHAGTAVPGSGGLPPPAAAARSVVLPMDVEQVARRLGLSRRRVRQLAEDEGSGLPGRKSGGRWLFNPADVEAYRRER